MPISRRGIPDYIILKEARPVASLLSDNLQAWAVVLWSTEGIPRSPLASEGIEIWPGAPVIFDGPIRCGSVMRHYEGAVIPDIGPHRDRSAAEPFYPGTSHPKAAPPASSPS